MLDWFDIRSACLLLSVYLLIQPDCFFHTEFRLYQWFRKNTLDRLSFTKSAELAPPVADVWKERQEAEMAVKGYLSDLPSEF